MKKIFIIISIITVGTLAFIDASERIKELDAIAANTPSQVELNQSMESQDMHSQGNSYKTKPEYSNLKKNSGINKDENTHSPFNNFKEKRKSITKPVN